MKNKRHAPKAKSIPRGNASKSPKSSQKNKAGEIDNSSSPDARPPQDGTRQPLDLSPDEIAARAYFHYQTREPGNEDHLEDWFRAEAELAEERDQA